MPDYGHALAFGYFLQPESAKTDFPAVSPGDFKIDQAGMFYLALVEQLLSIVKQICAGYLGYPFQNKQVKSFVENLVIDGGTTPWLSHTADAVADTLPNARRYTIAGQPHNVADEAMAPVLIEYFQS